MKQKRTISIQDYLKTIYELTETGESASTNALAQKMKISAPSADRHAPETGIGKARVG